MRGPAAESDSVSDLYGIQKTINALVSDMLEIKWIR